MQVDHVDGEMWITYADYFKICKGEKIRCRISSHWISLHESFVFSAQEAINNNESIGLVLNMIEELIGE